MAIKNGIGGYIASFIKFAIELKNQVDNSCSYKIVAISQDDEGNVVIKIQIMGGSTILTCYPKEIVSHNGFLDGFSKQDVRTITYHATKSICMTSIQITNAESHIGNKS